MAQTDNTYTVVSGDTLWNISLKLKVPFEDLLKANTQIANPDLIYVGQKLNIPKAL